MVEATTYWSDLIFAYRTGITLGMVYGAGGYLASSSKPTQQVSDREEWQSGPDLILELDFGIKTLQIDFVAFQSGSQDFSVG